MGIIFNSVVEQSFRPEDPMDGGINPPCVAPKLGLYYWLRVCNNIILDYMSSFLNI